MRLKEVQGVKIEEKTSVDELVRGLGGCAFGAGRLAEAVDIYEEMLQRGEGEKTTKFLGVAGALVPAGMRTVLAEMIRERLVDVVVTTGANLVHDILEALGERHYKIVGEAVGGADPGAAVDDVWLRGEGSDRIYDVIVRDEAFARLEDFLRGVFEKLGQKREEREEREKRAEREEREKRVEKKEREKRYSIRELTRAIGKSLSDPGSILRSAAESGVPVFCPAIADSMIGLHAWIYKQTSDLRVDAFEDMKELVDIFCEAKRTGVLILGGGVPKNFIFQTALVAPPRVQGRDGGEEQEREREREGFDYAIQITTETPENGGLSGATLDEAKSWGKVGANARAVTVYCDATIALPIIVAAVRERTARV